MQEKESLQKESRPSEHLEPFFYEFGYSCYQEGKFQKAIEMFRLCSIIDPKKARNWLSLGSALMMAGKPGDAIDPLTMAGFLDPDDPRPLLFRVECLLSQNKHTDAEILLKEIEMKFSENKELQKNIEVIRLQLHRR